MAPLTRTTSVSLRSVGLVLAAGGFLAAGIGAATAQSLSVDLGQGGVTERALQLVRPHHRPGRWRPRCW